MKRATNMKLNKPHISLSHVQPVDWFFLGVSSASVSIAAALGISFALYYLIAVCVLSGNFLRLPCQCIL